jgi:tagatose-6-phosphate ketose/aldose isomerase
MVDLEDNNYNRDRNPESTHTSSEIKGQPELWQKVFDLIVQKKKSITDFLSPVLKLENLRIILTGAGSSAFVGEAAQGLFQTETQRITQAIATTDLVTHPQSYFLRTIPTLFVSFARSGNSPESVEAVRLANVYCDKIFHLVITCNENGQLAKNSGGTNIYSLILPEAANDKALAMTGSFTSMLLSVMLIAKLDKIESLKPAFNQLIGNGVVMRDKYQPLIKAITTEKFERVIFLGSGPLLGIAHECHLKLQELTDGQVICKYDSFLGFRHGPRVVANEKSLVVFLFSNDESVFRYEKDLVSAIDSGPIALSTISFGRKISGLKKSILTIEFENSGDDFYAIVATLLGQMLGLYKSVNLGLEPDSPSVNGTISRVVEGVTIYN